MFSSVLNMYLITSSKAVALRCSVKKVLLNISQNSQENACPRVSFLIFWGTIERDQWHEIRFFFCSLFSRNRADNEKMQNRKNSVSGHLFNPIMTQKNNRKPETKKPSVWNYFKKWLLESVSSFYLWCKSQSHTIYAKWNLLFPPFFASMLAKRALSPRD